MSKEKLVPEIRFKGFEGEWRKCKLMELSDSFEYGLNASAKEFDGKHKYIRITDIDDETRRFDETELTSPDIDISDKDNYRLQKNDILFARTGASVGKSYVYNEVDGILYYAGFLIRARIKPQYNARFIFQSTLTTNYIDFVRINSQRSGQPGINATEYSEFQLNIPSLEEQSKVAKYLSGIDDVVYSKKIELQKLIQFKQAMLQKMFPKEGEKVPEIRFEGFEGEWEKRTLGSSGNTFTGLSGKTRDDFGYGDALYIPYTNVFKNQLTDINSLEEIGVDNTQNEVKYGDIFFTTSSETPDEVGMASVWKHNKSNVYLNSFCFGYRPTELFDLNFIAYLLHSPLVRSQFQLLAQGISRFNISKIKAMDISFLVPLDSEQQLIGEYFQALDQNIQAKQKELEKLKQFKQAMLQKMFV